VVVIIAGLASCGIISPILDRKRSHKLVLKGCFIMATFALSLFSGFCSPGHWGALLVSCLLLGAASFPVLPISLELGVECTWPIAEGTSSG